MIYDIQSEEQLRTYLEGRDRSIITIYNNYSSQYINDYKEIGDQLLNRDFFFVNLDQVSFSDQAREEFMTTALPCVNFYEQQVIRVEMNPSTDKFHQLATNF